MKKKEKKEKKKKRLKMCLFEFSFESSRISFLTFSNGF